jgi:hypothetical protein
VNDTQLLERLGTAYASVAAPVPSAELAARMDRGAVGDADDDGTRDAVVVPLIVRQPRARLRYSVAAAVAALAVFSGLAVAGALPDPLQRQVSSFASHFGLDLPNPGDGSDRSSAPEHSNTTPATLPITTEPVVPPAAETPGTPTTPGPTTAGTTTAATTAGALRDTLGQVGAIGGSVTTTIPPTGGSPLPEPEVTLPPPTAPQVTLPSTTLPSTTLPPPTLPLVLPTLPPLPRPGL